LIEKVMQKQSLEFRYEMASSQAKLQADIKDQLDDFLSSMMKFKSPTSQVAGRHQGSAG
jgi:superoxide dismutase